MSEGEVDPADDEFAYGGEDDIGPVVNSVSDDEEDSNGKQPLPQMPEFRPDIDMRDPQLRLGLVFPDAKTFKDVVRGHAIKEGKTYGLRKMIGIE